MIDYIMLLAIHQGSIDGTYPPVTGRKAPGGNPAGNNTEYDKKCYDIDECAWNVCNGEHQLCYNKNGSYDCLCEWGYNMTTVCDIPDINNLDENGDPVENCIDICININECEGTYPCVNTTYGSDYCIDTVSGYSI